MDNGPRCIAGSCGNLYLISGGLLDIRCPDGSFYRDRFEKRIRGYVGSRVEHDVADILRDCTRHGLTDDLTILAASVPV